MPTRLWQAAANGVLKDIWSMTGTVLSEESRGQCQAVFASSPAGDAIKLVWAAESKNEPLLSVQEARKIAFADQPVTLSDDGQKTHLAIRLPGRQLGVVVLDDRGETYHLTISANSSEDRPPIVALADIAAEAIDRAVDDQWRKFEEKTPLFGTTKPHTTIVRLLQLALRLTGFEWGYVACATQPGDGWLHRVASLGNGAFQLDHIPTDFPIYRELRRTGRAVVKAVAAGGSDQLGKNALKFLKIRYGSVKRKAFLQSLALVRHCIAWPIRLDGQLIGFLALHASNPRRPPVHDLDFLMLEPISRRLCIELQTWDALRRSGIDLRDAAHEFGPHLPDDSADNNVLHHDQSTSPSAARDTLCTRLAEEAAVTTPTAYRAAVMMFVPVDNVLTMAGRWGFWSSEFNTRHIPMTEVRSMCVRALQSRELVYLPNIDANDPAATYVCDIPEKADKDPTRSSVAIPIRSGSTVVGVLAVDSMLPDAFKEAALTPLRNLVQRYAEAIAKYHAVHHMDLLNGLLREISRDGLGATHYDRCLRLIIDISGARYGTLFVRCPKRGTLVPRARTHGVPDEGTAEYEFGQRKTGTIALSRRVVRLNSLNDRKRLCDVLGLTHFPEEDSSRPLLDSADGPHPRRPVLYIPIEAGGEVVGILRLRRNEAEPFSPMDEELAHQCANLFGGAIHHEFDQNRTWALQSLAKHLYDESASTAELTSNLFGHVERVLGKSDMLVWVVDHRPLPAGEMAPVLRCIYGRGAGGETLTPANQRFNDTALEVSAWREGVTKYDPGTGANKGTSEVQIPVKTDGTVVGVVTLKKSVPHAFAEGEIRFLDQAAELAGRAIHRHGKDEVAALITKLHEKLVDLLSQTWARGQSSWNDLETSFFRNALGSIEAKLKAKSGYGLVVRVDEKNVVSLLGPGDSDTDMLNATAVAGTVNSMENGYFACKSRDLIRGQVAKPYPVDCFVIRLTHEKGARTAFLLFDDERGKVDFGRVKGLSEHLRVIAAALDLARKRIREHRMDRVNSSMQLLGSMVVNAHHAVRAPITRLIEALDTAKVEGRMPDLDKLLDDATKTKGFLEELVISLDASRAPRTGIGVRDILGQAREHVSRESLDPRADERLVLSDDIESDLTVYGIEVPLIHMFKHLFHNGLRAVKDKPANGRVEARARRGDAATVQITVCDNGDGMTAEILDQLYNPFFKTSSEGTGLGMSSVYSIVKYHNGEIDVASQPGSGTQFTITLPIE